MATLVGTFRLGRDAKKVSGPNGDFLSLSLAYDAYTDGVNKTQWISATFGGKQADGMAPHLTKGSTIYAVIKDPRPATYDGKDGPVLHLEGRIIDADFAGGKRREDESDKADN